jgi:hypothetical protein
VGDGAPVGDRLGLWPVPWWQPARPKAPACRGPHRWDCGAGFCRPPARARQASRPTFWQLHPCPGSALRLGTGGQQPRIAVCCSGLDFGPRGLEPVLKQSQRTLVQALLEGFRRHRHRLGPWRHLRRPWRQRRGGVTPGPTGDEGQPQVACQRRRAAASRSSAEKKSVNRDHALGVPVGMGVTLGWGEDARGNPSYHRGETSTFHGHSTGYRFMRMGQAGHHGKKVSKVVEGKVWSLDRSLLMGEFPILYIPTDARGPSTQLLHTLE